MPYMLADTREEFERVRDVAGRRLTGEAARIADRRLAATQDGEQA